jgi:hypothetical protein
MAITIDDLDSFHAFAETRIGSVEDVRQVARWIAQRSLQGAQSWLDAYEAFIERLTLFANMSIINRKP